MANQNYVVRLLLESDNFTPQTQRAKAGLEDMAASARKVEGAQVRTVQSSQEFIRIIQDAPFGMMGITNNITALVDSLGNASRQAGSMGAAIKSTMKSLLTGPMAISLVIAAVTSLVLAWDKVSAGIDKARVKLGLFTEQQAELNAQVRELESTLEEINKADFFAETLEKIKDEHLLDAALLLKEQKDAILSGSPEAQEALDQLNAFDNRIQETSGDLQAVIKGQRARHEQRMQEIPAMREVNELEAGRISILSRLAKVTAEERALSIFPDEWFDKTKEAKHNMEDWLRFRTEIMPEGIDRAWREALQNRRDSMATLDEMRALDLMNEAQYLDAKRDINLQYITELSNIFTEDVSRLNTIQDHHRDIDRDNLADNLKAKLSWYEWFYGEKADLIEEDFERQERFEKQERDNILRTGRAYSQVAADIGVSFGDLATIMGEEGERAFEQNKSMLVAQATMQAISAGINVVSGLLAKPVITPLDIGVAVAAGASIVTGLMAQVRKIQSTNIGGGASGGAQMGHFTTLNPTATAQRVTNFEQNRDRAANVRDSGARRGLDRLGDRFDKQRIVYDDKTAEHITEVGRKQVEKLNTTS